MGFRLSLFGGLEGGFGQGFRLLYVFDHGSSARWLVSEFAEKRFFKSVYVLYIRFVYMVGLALLEMVRLCMLDAGAVWAV
jgi:hypothetical protein